jgi:hypothetical protein
MELIATWVIRICLDNLFKVIISTLLKQNHPRQLVVRIWEVDYFVLPRLWV